ncbi:MAG: right-handed parallel beta-helix repeat-containing protein, partial [Verrucomicrobiales bacterium]
MLRLLFVIVALSAAPAAIGQSIKIYGQSGPNRWDVIADGDINSADHPATNFGTITVGDVLSHSFRIENVSASVIELAGAQSNDSSFRAQIPPQAQRLDPREVVEFQIVFRAPAREARGRMIIGYAVQGQPLSEYDFFLSGEGERGEIYVDQTAVGNSDGSSWEHAFVELQDALAEAGGGSEPIIRVAEGVYYPDRGIGAVAGDRASSFVIPDGVSIYGGFSAGGGNGSPDIYRTILSGDIDDNDLNTDGNHISESPDDTLGSNAYSVVTIQGDALIRGVTITGGLADGDGVAELSQVAGAGIYVSSFGRELFVIDCAITGCAASRASVDSPAAAGAAIHLGRRGSLTVRESRISNNGLTDPFATAVDGALISVADGIWVRIDDCEFGGNRIEGGMAVEMNLIAAAGTGSGVFQMEDATFSGHRLTGADLVAVTGFPQASLVRCNVSDNECAGFVEFDGCATSRLESSVIHGNVFSSLVYLDGAVDLGAVNLTTSGNRAESVFRVRSEQASGTITLSNSVISVPLEAAAAPLGAGFELVRRNSLVPGFGADGEGNLDPATDARFRNPLSPSLAPTSAGDYRLLDDSPLIEAGLDEAGVQDDALDLIPRRLDWDLDGQLVPDIGAYESTRPAV